MNDEDRAIRTKSELIAEIERRIRYVAATDEIPDEARLAITRKVLHLIEHGEREE